MWPWLPRGNEEAAAIAMRETHTGTNKDQRISIGWVLSLLVRSNSMQSASLIRRSLSLSLSACQIREEKVGFFFGVLLCPIINGHKMDLKCEIVESRKCLYLPTGDPDNWPSILFCCFLLLLLLFSAFLCLKYL